MHTINKQDGMSFEDFRNQIVSPRPVNEEAKASGDDMKFDDARNRYSKIQGCQKVLTKLKMLKVTHLSQYRILDKRDNFSVF